METTHTNYEGDWKPDCPGACQSGSFHSHMSVGQIEILQEIITLSVFVPSALLYLKEPIKLDYLWAGLCLLGAVFCVFRSKLGGA